MEDTDLTPEEIQELSEAIGGSPSYPTEREKESLFARIIKTKDTTKVSNLNDEELFAVRQIQSAALYAKEMGLEKVAKYIEKEGEILLGTADSKEGFLIKMAITQKKELESKSKNMTGGKKTWLSQKK